MDFDAIGARLKGTFGEGIVPTRPERGDPYILVPREKILDVCRFCRQEEDLSFNSLHCITGLDYPAENLLALAYTLFSFQHRHTLILRVQVPREESPRIDSVEPVWPAAGWHEREAYDLFGFRFEGNGDLRRILLPDDWEGFPLRKDYKQAESWHGMKIDAGYHPPGGPLKE